MFLALGQKNRGGFISREFPDGLLDGSVRYNRIKGGATSSIDGPLKGFVGDNFEVGIGPLCTTFIVNKPPYQDGDAWKMVVDDIELTKTVQ